MSTEITESRLSRLQADFMYFLSRADALKEFEEELQRYGRGNLLTFTASGVGTPPDWISYGFSWVDTRQGNGYWSKLQGKWSRRYYEKEEERQA